MRDRMLRSFEIDDDVADADSGAIEVSVLLIDGRRRWCYFMTPAALSAVGDWVPGTRIRFHYGAPHMIVVSDVDTSIIEKVLQHLDEEGELEACTMAVE